MYSKKLSETFRIFPKNILRNIFSGKEKKITKHKKSLIIYLLIKDILVVV